VISPNSKRTLLKVMLVMAFKGLFISNTAKAALVDTDHESTLLAFINTIIPNALTQQLLRQIENKYQTNLKQKHLITWGCLWLDAQAKIKGKNSFYLLSEGQQIEIVTLAENSKKNSAEFYFFYTLRNSLMQYHYSAAYGLQPLGFSHPPQPLGYSDYNQKPEDSL
jgi:hypothetical protein